MLFAESVAVIEKGQKKGNMEMKESLTSLQKSLDDSKLVTASIKGEDGFFTMFK